ncbi:LOW QUALITY PROTEIN: hypothetical protein HID58_044986 [Brassica napus]|uniref:Uncharacterized protein n=1 Tax=Brassica napus TaxID=3708 RepID=A0ABQ8AT88_BRANA|nr:LOW QUALITY PROTEIN: hypothetical protein HID58_044986 [Brassica napus]
MSKRRRRGSFFNWFYFMTNVGAMIASPVLVWIQMNVAMLDLAVAALLFFAGSNFYMLQKPGGSPITRMLQVIESLLGIGADEVALGNYQSTLLVTVVTKVTTTGGRPGWIADNLNRDHLDYYYYWLLARPG